MQLFIWNPKRRQISDYPVKGKGCRDLFVGSVGAWMVSRPPLPPSEASWAPLTPCEQGTDFQSLVGLESTASQHLEGIMLLLPKVETLGPNDARETVCVFTKLCAFYREWLNYIVLWVLEYETVTSWEILRVEWGWHWEVKTEMMGDSEIQCTLSMWRGGMGAHA